MEDHYLRIFLKSIFKIVNKTGLYQGRCGSGSLVLREAAGNSGKRGVLRGRLRKDARF